MNIMTLKPVLGTNQYKTKISFEWLKLETRTLVIIAFTLMLLVSLFGNYMLLKTFMVFKCSDGGYFITKQYCGELYQNANASIELDRMNNNLDLYQ